MITPLIMRLISGESSANPDDIVEARRSLLLRPATNSRWPDVYFEVAPDSADAITDVDGVPAMAALTALPSCDKSRR